VIFRSPECPTLAERVAEIFGRQTAAALVPLEAGEAGMRLSGLIGRPGAGRATRHEMIVFVNQRPVDSRTLNYALIESYHESLPKGRYPLAFVFFECDPAAVDVNVHPAKREVRFRSEPAVRAFVIRSVLQRLRELGVAAAPPAAGMGDGRLPNADWRNGPAMLTGRPEGFYAPPMGRAGVPVAGPGAATMQPAAPGRPGLPMASIQRMDDNTLDPEPPAPNRPSAIGNAAALEWRYVGLAHGTYALFETAAGLVLLDRRAAHERVWFERLREQFQSGAVPSQRLLLPVPVELDPILTALLLDRLAFLRAHGFEIAEFGRNFFRIEAVPVWMEPADAEPFLRDLLGAFREGRVPDHNPGLAREELARLAAAKAVRLPATAGEAELQALAAQLFATRAPLTSPAGRPTYIELQHGELARRFQK
jgi:DNA mismatch repair protein MutL